MTGEMLQFGVTDITRDLMCVCVGSLASRMRREGHTTYV